MFVPAESADIGEDSARVSKTPRQHDIIKAAGSPENIEE